MSERTIEMKMIGLEKFKLVRDGVLRNIRNVREVQVFVAYLLLVIAAEGTTSFVDAGYGVLFHSVILVSLLALSALRFVENPSSKFFLSLSLAPLIRIVSLSLPLAHFPRYAWYLVASVPVLAATVTSMRVQGVGFGDAGITFKRPLAQAKIALTGIPFGFVEYFILGAEPLALDLSFGGLVVLGVALIFCTGLVEELVFRGVMQPNAVEALGDWAGIVGVAAVFAALHIGWLSLFDVVFVFVIGLFFGYCALKTGSIVGVSLAHGITNVLLFLVAPRINLISIL